MSAPTRRSALLSAGGAGLMLSGCSRIVQSDRLIGDHAFQQVLKFAQDWTYQSQRFLLGGGALAREYKPSEITAKFYANGTTNPDSDEYDAWVDDGFASWRLKVDGMVARPMSLTLDQLKRLPARTQITRHDCVEGWSAIGGWTGVPLGLILKSAGVLPGAKYVIFHCADNLEGESAKGGQQAPGQYYESLDLTDATHPQTILAYAMNGRPLEVAHGAPLRLRVERQLGYKHAKYLERIEVVPTLAGVAGGKGGYWEDRGYDWYAGM